MEEKGFFGRLFDLSFSEFVTTKIIKVLFVLVIIGSAIFALTLIGSGFRKGAGTGILFLVLSPLVFFVYVLIGRIWCEIIMVIFRIAENTNRLVERENR